MKEKGVPKATTYYLSSKTFVDLAELINCHGLLVPAYTVMKIILKPENDPHSIITSVIVLYTTPITFSHPKTVDKY